MTSAIVDPAVESVSERSARATREFCEALRLGSVKPKDLKLLTIALAEVATQEARNDSRFADRVRSVFQELTVIVPKEGAGKKVKVQVNEPLVPVGPVDPSKFRPHAPLDPYALYEAYGESQSLRVLNDLTLESLKQSAAIVEERNPGTKPANRRARAALITYIVEQVIPK